MLPRPPCYSSPAQWRVACLANVNKGNRHKQSWQSIKRAHTHTHTHPLTHSAPTSLFPPPLCLFVANVQLTFRFVVLAFSCTIYITKPNQKRTDPQRDRSVCSASCSGSSYLSPPPLGIGLCWLEFDVCSFIIHFALAYITLSPPPALVAFQLNP